MRAYEFKSTDGIIDVWVLTDGFNDIEAVTITETPRSLNDIPESIDELIKLGFYFVEGNQYFHQDFVQFAINQGLVLLQWNMKEGNEEPIELTGDQEDVWVYKFNISTSALTLDEVASTAFVQVYSVRVKGTEVEQIDFTGTTGGTTFNWNNELRTITVGDNPTTTRRTGVLTLTQEDSGIVRTVQLSQLPAWEYTFLVSPTTVNLDKAGQTQILYINSNKHRENEVEGVPYTGVISGDSNITWNNDSHTITAPGNSSASSRTATLTITQEETDSEVTVNISQENALIGYLYTFSVNPTSLSFAAAGQSQNYSVTSIRQKQVDGVPEGDPEDVAYTNEYSGDAGVYTIDEVNHLITAVENTTTSTRTGAYTFTQPRATGNPGVATLNLTQAAAEE